MQWSKEPDHDKMSEFLEKAEKQEWTVRELAAEVEIYKRNKEREFALHNTPEKFDVIYADPPWQYDDECLEGAIQSGGASKHYPVMSIAELCGVPVKDISSDNAVLFLWVTSPIISECWDVIRAWGFEYKSMFVWDKVRHNMGHYNSVRHELLLICTKGSYLPSSKKLYDSVISIEKTDEHSRKPEEFRQIIEAMYPEGRKIELFARGKVPTGWVAWGNEAEE
jgi:N6-adenosine-specific RNA methylase IME4